MMDTGPAAGHGIPGKLREVYSPPSNEDGVSGIFGKFADAQSTLPQNPFQCKKLCRALARPHLSLRHLARIIGALTASIQANFPALLYYRALLGLKISHLREGISYADWITLDPEANGKLRWWLRHMEV